MKPFIAQTLRSRWLAGTVHAGTWLLLYLAVIGMGGRAPVYREADGSAPPPQMPLPIGKLDRLFVTGSWPSITGNTNAPNAFFTRYFTPIPAPAPPPPTTKKIELTYQGYYFTERGLKQTLIKMGDGFLITAEGSNVTANLFAARASMDALLLTNSVGGTNLLALNKKQAVEVPIK